MYLERWAVQLFTNQVPFLEHLAAKGIDIFDGQTIRPFTEAGVWGAIRHHGLIGNTVIVSDDAGQFRVGIHALCRVGGSVATPPLTDPDEQISCIRFIMVELGSRWRTYERS